jgi:proline iminopeptidase
LRVLKILKNELIRRLLLLLGVIACASNADDSFPREGFVTGMDGAQLYYRVIGTGVDTVVVVHGGPGAGMNSVLPDFQRLAGDLTLIFYDQRGGGRSTLPADTAELDARYFIADLDSVRVHFGLGRMKLLGHSFGSIIIASYAQAHAEHVERIVLHGATGPVRAEAARLARSAAPSPDTALSRRSAELLGELLDGTATDPVAICKEREEIGRRLAGSRGESGRWSGSTCEAPAEAVRYYYRYTAQFAPETFGDWDFREGLENVEAPALIIAGDRDSLDLAVQEAWVEGYPNGHLLIVPAAGKTAMAERPDEVRAAVVRFLGGS